jgi:putative Mg2+ transporter-C (MgtC) family protein
MTTSWLAALPPDLQVLAEVAVAMVFGAAIGFEREWAERPAGLRTHMLVAGAAAMFVGIALGMVERHMEYAWADRLSIDPVRVMQAIVVGVTFLGAGTILHNHDNRQVEGLTTAASLLVVAGIGIAVAMQMLVLAAGVTLLILVALRGLVWLQRLVPPKSQPHSTQDRDCESDRGTGVVTGKPYHPGASRHPAS